MAAMNAQHASVSAARQNLRRLTNIRYIALVAQLLGLYLFLQFHPVDLPLRAITCLVIGFALINGLTQWRSYWQRSISQLEFGGHLLVDIIALSALMYVTGGASNPFISYYLVPICIAATILPMAMTWAIGLLAIAAYTTLLFFYIPVEGLQPHHGSTLINLHVVGMLVNFVLSAGLIIYFVMRMAGALKTQEAELIAQKEEQMQDEHVLAIATLAAGAAHELGTPLNTMGLLIEDDGNKSEPKTLNHHELDILRQQIDRCQKTLQSLVNAANIIEKPVHSTAVVDYVDDLLDTWLLIRPDVDPEIDIDAESPAIRACFHPVIRQSLQNLLNNAADASPEHLKISVRWDRNQLHLDIRDHGPGLTATQTEKLGRPQRSRKAGGLGLGLFLTKSSLNRHGGEVRLSNAEGGGLLTEVRLPLREVSDG